MEEEELKTISVRDMIRALAEDLITLENNSLELSIDDLREEIANIVANQITILNIIFGNSKIIEDVPKELYS